MQTTVYLHHDDKIKKIPIPIANQFQLAIEHFCAEIQNDSNKKNNFEKDLLEQALIMDAIRKSFAKNSVIRIQN